MRAAWLRIVGLVCAVVCGCTSTPADPTAQRLVGRWSQVTYPDGARDEITVDLEAEGTVRAKVRRHTGSGMRDYIGSGTWRVEHGYFVSTLALEGPANAVDHLAGRRRIVAVTDWEWVIEWDKGEQVTAWRYPK
jgi:hypothetical protein